MELNFCHCGKRPRVYEVFEDHLMTKSKRWNVECRDCKIEMFCYSTKERAIQQWNDWIGNTEKLTGYADLIEKLRTTIRVDLLTDELNNRSIKVREELRNMALVNSFSINPNFEVIHDKDGKLYVDGQFLFEVNIRDGDEVARRINYLFNAMRN